LICVALSALLTPLEAAEEDQELTVVLAVRHRAILSSEIGARITDIKHEFGERFEKDEILITLDDTESRRVAEKARSILTVAETGLKATQKLHTAKTVIRQAESELEAAKAHLTLLTDLAKKGTQKKKVQAEVAVAKRNLNTTEKLFRDGVASDLDYESAKKDLTISEANLVLSEAQQKTELQTARKAVTDAEIKLEMTLVSLSPELATAEKDVAIAQSNLRSAEKELKSCVIRAPFKGRVKRLAVNNHELVQKGQNLIEVVDDSTLLAQFLVPSNEIQSIKRGQEVSIKVIELEQSVKATISHISATIDPASQSFMVYAEIDNGKQALRSGMRGILIFTPKKKVQP
jgi:multidrug resistance efflux pump